MLVHDKLIGLLNPFKYIITQMGKMSIETNNMEM